MSYQEQNGSTTNITQMTYSQALQMVGKYCNTSEAPDSSADQVSTVDVSYF